MGIIDHKLDVAAVNPLFETLVSCVSDGVLITDETGQVLCLNDAFKDMLGDAGVSDGGLARIINQAERKTCAAVSYSQTGSPSIILYAYANSSIATVPSAMWTSISAR